MSFDLFDLDLESRSRSSKQAETRKSLLNSLREKAYIMVLLRLLIHLQPLACFGSFFRTLAVNSVSDFSLNASQARKKYVCTILSVPKQPWKICFNIINEKIHLLVFNC